MINAKKLREGRFNAEYVQVVNSLENQLVLNHDEYEMETVILIDHKLALKLVGHLLDKGYDVEYNYNDSVLRLNLKW